MTRLSRQQPARNLRVVVLTIGFLLVCWAPLCRANEPSDVPVAQDEIVPEEDIVSTDNVSPEVPVEPANEKSEASTKLPNNEQPKNGAHHGEESHCAWGTACHPDYVEEHGQQQHQQQQSNDETKKNGANTSNSNNSGNIPFVHHHSSSHGNTNIVPPPEGFTIVARVYTDPSDRLAHFTDDEEGSQITLPYWECGATGSTTSPLPIKHAYFRHSLSGSKSQVWSGTEYGPHPQLVVALKRMEMTLNSGETKILKAGDVVLLEDVVSGGHKLKALEGFDMTYLLLTLPQHYHHVGRDQMALKRVTTEKIDSPCEIVAPSKTHSSGVGVVGGGSAFVNKQTIPKQDPKLSSNSKSWENILAGGRGGGGGGKDGRVVPLREPKLRKLILGAFGFSLSALMADFLGKVAPLWLAVAIGGTCFVVGGTAAFVQGGDYLCSEIEMWQERRRLEIPGIDDEVDTDEPEVERPIPKAAAA